MNLLRLVLGLMAGGALLIGGAMGWARRTEQGPQLVVTAMEGRGTAVYTVDAPSGKVRRLNGLDKLDARLITISPDGKWLIYGVGGKVLRTSLWGTQARAIHFPKPDIQVDWYGFHQWSADGRWLVLETIDLDIMNSYPELHLYRVNMDTLDVERLSQQVVFRPHHADVFFYATPDQEAVVYYGTTEESVNLYRVEIATGNEIRLTNQRDIEEPNGWFEDWLIYWSPIDGALYRVRLDGTGEEKLIPDASFEWVEHTPIDGWLYVGSYHDDNTNSELYRLRWGGTELERLTTLDGYEDLITISPDAAWLYYMSGETLYRMRLDGSEQAVVAEGVQYGRALGWSDDGTAFYFHDGVFDVEVNLQRLVTDTFAIESVGQVYAVPIAMTPDGAWMAYTRVGDEKRGVTILETRTGQAHRVDLPITPFEIFGWMPLVEQTWRPHAALVGGGMGLLVSMGMGRLRKWA